MMGNVGSAHTRLRIMAISRVSDHPDADTGHQEEGNQEHGSQQFTDGLTCSLIVGDEHLQFDFFEPFTGFWNRMAMFCMPVIRRCCAVCIHEPRLSSAE